MLSVESVTRDDVQQRQRSRQGRQILATELDHGRGVDGKKPEALPEVDDADREAQLQRVSKEQDDGGRRTRDADESSTISDGRKEADGLGQVGFDASAADAISVDVTSRSLRHGPRGKTSILTSLSVFCAIGKAQVFGGVIRVAASLLKRDVIVVGINGFRSVVVCRRL